VGASSAGSPECQRGAVDQHTCEAGGGWVHIRSPGPAANAPRCTVHNPFGTEVPFLSPARSLSFGPTVVVNLRQKGASHRPPDRHNERTTGPRAPRKGAGVPEGYGPRAGKGIRWGRGRGHVGRTMVCIYNMMVCKSVLLLRRSKPSHTVHNCITNRIALYDKTIM